MMALEGLLIVDATQAIAGPYATMALGDAGADIIKVEPLNGDTSRGWGPPFVGDQSAVFLGLNRNKRSVALDLESTEGRQVLLRLIERADVFIEDWEGRQAEEKGFDYETLAAINPRLIYCSMTAFGENGPFRDRAGSELVAQAMGEATSSLGAIGEPPIRIGADLASMSTGIFTFQGIVAALFHRARSGKGQQVSTSLLGSMMFMRSTLWAAHSDPDEWYGFHLDSYIKPPDYCYEASDGQFYFNFTRGLTEDKWQEFMAAAGLPDEHVDDPRFSSYVEALGNGRFAYLIQPLWNECFRKKSFDDISAIVTSFGGNAWRLNNYQQLFDHPQSKVLGLAQQLEHPTAGTITTTGFPWQMEKTPATIRLSPPLLGQHNTEILEAAGYSLTEITELKAQGIIAD
ncbi:CoA transferase [Dehalococcoidia bacterium]|nr:CoA transferase [Dehalococcoidia bacterium]